jgi:hypothetical protein
MKYSKLFAIVFVVIVFVLFFMNRPVREKLCPLTKDALDAAAQQDCLRTGGVFKDGKCTCPP